MHLHEVNESLRYHFYRSSSLDLVIRALQRLSMVTSSNYSFKVTSINSMES